MSVHFLSACWKLEGLTSTQKFVLISLADQANDQGVCWPSIRSIMSRTCLSERAVQTALRELITMNLLRKDERINQSSVFTVTVSSSTPAADAPPAPRAPGQQMREEGQDVHPTPAADAPHPRTTCTQNRNRTVIEPSNKKPLSSDDDEQKQAKAERIPHDAIFDLYNEIVANPFGRPLVRVRNEKRKRLIRKIWDVGKETKTLDWWRRFFTLATQNDGWMNGRQFKDGFWEGANFDFILREDNFLKVVE